VPTYSYACTACEHQFDTVQQFTDPSLTDCPVCAGRLRKLFSSVGIVFKGSGFYRTDSRSSSSDKPDSDKPDSDKAKSDKPSSNGKSEGKSGATSSKSAPTTAPKPAATSAAS
jgi:putative FmdB family regulatory protein